MKDHQCDYSHSEKCQILRLQQPTTLAILLHRLRRLEYHTHNHNTIPLSVFINFQPKATDADLLHTLPLAFVEFLDAKYVLFGE